jgi:hypothetical protein
MGKGGRGDLQMLTDVFFVRYETIPLFKTFSEREKKLLFQCFTLVEDVRPFWGSVEHSLKRDRAFWETVHKRLSNEIGVRWLSNPGPDPIIGNWQYRVDSARTREWIEICRKWMLEIPGENDDIDRFIKERISLVEIGLREILASSEFSAMSPRSEALVKALLAESKKKEKSDHDAASAELNVRLRIANVPLSYHNGYLQVTADEVIAREVEQPFWSIVSDPIWVNVDLDMKEALDQRDSGGKDPAFYAGKALESTIKIISGLLKVTHGNEKGAHGYIDNIAKSSVRFIEKWEAEFLKHYFTNVRNPLGHGPGLEPMPSLTFEQSSLAIEIAMSWIRMLAERAHKQSLFGGTP